MRSSIPRYPEGDAGCSVLGGVLLSRPRCLFCYLLLGLGPPKTRLLVITLPKKITLKRRKRAESGSDDKGCVLREPLPPLTASFICDGLDETVTSNTIWFRPNHDMIQCRIYRPPVYGGQSTTLGIAQRIMLREQEGSSDGFRAREVPSLRNRFSRNVTPLS